MAIYIGIDPGKQGAIALISGQNVTCYSMPLKADGSVDACELANCLRTSSSVFAMVEYINAFGMGRQSAFVFGQGYGSIIATLDLVGIGFELAAPQKWQGGTCGSIRDKKKQKQHTLAWVQNKFPDVDGWPSTKAAREGWGDAIAIAEYNRRLNG